MCIMNHSMSTVLRMYLIYLLQMKEKCPNLREISGSLLDVIHPDFPKRDISCYLENLLDFFFSPGTTSVTEDDMRWFFILINEQLTLDFTQDVIAVGGDVDLSSMDSPEGPGESPLFNVLAPSVARHFLRRILTHKVDDEKPVKPLSIFYRMVSAIHTHTTPFLHMYILYGVLYI